MTKAEKASADKLAADQAAADIQAAKSGTPPPTPETVIKAEPTSENLTKLKAEKKAAFAASQAILADGKDEDSQEYLDAELEVFRIKGLIKAEISKIEADARQAKIDEENNARVAMVTNYETAAGINVEALSDEAKGMRELIVNELLKTVKGSTSAKSAGTANGNGGRGEKSAAILAILKSEMAAGKSLTDAKKSAVAQGHAVGTTGSVATLHFLPDGTPKA